MQRVTITLDDDLIAAAGSRNCVAALVYETPDPEDSRPSRLSQATLHVHLDHESCLEVTVFKGRRSEVQSFANHVIAERGVRHGHVVYVQTPNGQVHRRSHEFGQ